MFVLLLFFFLSQPPPFLISRFSLSFTLVIPLNQERETLRYVHYFNPKPQTFTRTSSLSHLVDKQAENHNNNNNNNNNNGNGNNNNNTTPPAEYKPYVPPTFQADTSHKNCSLCNKNHTYVLVLHLATRCSFSLSFLIVRLFFADICLCSVPVLSLYQVLR
jgi:hypothetical protein